MNFPLVSIIIPVYNGSNYLQKAIDSALAQTYQNIDIIVINDGSTDGGATENIALSYGDQIRYFKKQNGGVASALNLGISQMRGRFFSWLSHDDLYKPDKIEIQINEAKKYGPKTIFWSDFDTVNKDGKIINSFTLYAENKKTDAFVILSTYLHGCSLLIPTSVFEEVGLFNEKLMTAQDNEMWIRILKAGYKFEHIGKKLICSRSHDAQGQVTMQDTHKEEVIGFYRWAIDYLGDELLPSNEELKAILSKKGIRLEI